MHQSSRVWTPVLASGAVWIGLVAFHHARMNDALRAEVASLRAAIRPMDTVPKEHEALLKLEPQEAELKTLQENQAEAQRLSAEIARIKAEISASPPPIKSESRGPLVMIDLTVVNQVIEAARVGNTQRLAELMIFSTEDKAEAESLFTQLPEQVREQYGDARHLMSSIAAVALYPAEVKEVKRLTTDLLTPIKESMTLHLELRGNATGPDPAPIDCVFRRGYSGGFLLVVSPEMMASYRQAVAAASAKK